MFGLFKKKPEVARHKRVEFLIPASIVVRHDPETFKDRVVGKALCLRLRSDVQEWCNENNIKVGRVMPHAIFGEIPLGPFSLELFSERDAVHFKLMWSAG